MEKFTQFLFSMRMMAIGMLIFLLAIGAATFIESAYDTQTARIIIYNALWFEILLAFLAINLISNIFTYKMYTREKIALFFFHISFIIILIGAAITRFISFEGQMQIPEGNETNIIFSADPYMQIEVRDEKQMLRNRIEEKMYMSEITDNFFYYDIDFPNRDNNVIIEYLSFHKNMVDSLVVNDSIRESTLEFVIQGKPFYLTEGRLEYMDGFPVTFNVKEISEGISIREQGRTLLMRSTVPLKYTDMSKLTAADRMNPSIADSFTVEVPMDTTIQLETGKLYTAGEVQFVFRKKIVHARKMMMPSGRDDRGKDIVKLKISDGEEVRLVDLKGGMNSFPENELFEWNGLVYEMKYGSKPIEIPFNVGCVDFQLDRYPGSNSPSSFASVLYINDTKRNHIDTQRIFMNHVMDYDGYRFFQSSYFPDESGTILSVNHDWWGTNVTYFGYLLMAVAMIMSLFARSGRFVELNNKLRKIRKRKNHIGVSILLMLLSMTGIAQETNADNGPRYTMITEDHAEKIETLLVQDMQGRIIPYHTFCEERLRKISRDNTFENFNAVQVITSMHMYFEYWSKKDIIYVSSALRKKLGVNKSHVSLIDLMNERGDFKLMEDYMKAHRKLESKRNEYDKKLIKLEERYEVITSIFLWRDMKIIPLPGDPNDTWMIPMSTELMRVDSMPSKIAFNYFNELDRAATSNDYKQAEVLLSQLKLVQRKLAGDVAPSESKVETEVMYNKMNVFQNTLRMYSIFGLALLILFFIRVFVNNSDNSERVFRRIALVFKVLLAVVFFYHGAGLGMRWYITGHAPWSNGYEAVVFIGWVTMIVGFIFSRKNAAVLACTTILAMLMLFVTEMNLLDPQITPLVPVLKSYWLMIHVAIITGSYGFLGVGCILGILNLILYIFRTPANGEKLTLNINELTFIAEMTITIGLFMLTIGTFLGGIWANESWGRYWGWDPKETWALVSVLVYAVILHLRFIPGLKSKFLFNSVSVWGYSAILFTFFGVNFYLVGLHSYAQGEGMGQIPNYLIITVLIFVLLTWIAWLRYRSYTKVQKGNLLDEL